MLVWLALAAAAPADASGETPAHIVQTYYAAVSRHDYRTAYALWHGRQGYAHFRHGYARTKRASVGLLGPVETEGAVGSLYATVKVGVDALLRSGKTQHFAGSYTLRRANDVPGATPTLRRWHIINANLAKVPAGR